MADHRELVAAQPGHDVTRADALLQPRRERHEDQVTHVVAERVVQDLEAVEVDVEHGGRGRHLRSVAVCRRAPSNLVANRRRFANPVRVSWLAAWSSEACS
jgi:hypothetical protein